MLLDTVWGGTGDTYANVVDLYVSHLRKKLDRYGGPSHIRTVRGLGYAFDPQPHTDVNRTRLRLTAAYVGILALILVFVVTVAVVAFSHQESARQDDLLRQQAQSKANGLLQGQPEGPSTSPIGTQVTWTAVRPDGSFFAPPPRSPTCWMRSTPGRPSTRAVR